MLKYMTPEEKAAIAAAAEAEKNGNRQEEANADDAAPEPIEGSETEEAEEVEPSTPDYEAIAKAESERAEAAERAAAEEAFKAREARRNNGKSKEEADSETTDDDEDRPLTLREARQIISREAQTIQKTTQERAALEIARANTATEAEAQAAFLFYKNRVIPTGNLEEDILFAIGGLNRRRAAAKTKEVVRALRSKDTVARSSANVYREQPPIEEPKISAADAQGMKAQGMKWDGKKRLYVKPLGNGKKIFFYDPKTRKRGTMDA